MDVFLTIDVECYSGDYEREVHGNGMGLAYVLEMCRTHGARATFFVEALGATQWGMAPVRRICDMVHDAGQEVQLHIHPVTARIEGFTHRDDVLWNHDLETQTRLINTGLKVLKECGVDNVMAFRAGDFAANEDTVKAMVNCGIGIGSNRDLDSKSSTRSRLNDFFPVRNDLSGRDGVIDVPVSVLRSTVPILDGKHRHMEISAMGLGEMCDGLSRMAQAGYSCAGMLTHPAEFFRNTSGRTVPVKKNRKRLEGLLEFLRGRDDMRMLLVGECKKGTMAEESQPPAIKANLLFSLMRVAEQAVQRIESRK